MVVIFLKIFFIRKQFLKICLVLFIVLTGAIIFMTPVLPSMAIELSKNSVLSKAAADRIANLSNETEKIAYLTFDDGPNPSVTPKILDILKEKNIKATFFVIGKNVDAHPEIVERAYEEGHFIANHGYNHNNNILYKNEKNFVNEVKNTDLAIGNAVGIENYCSHIFRFPNGFISSNYKSKKEKAVKLLEEMNYAYIDWNCLNHDSMKKYNRAQLLNNLKKTAKDKNTLVVLMHDTKDVSDSSSVLKESIDYLKSSGYSFKNFYDIL